MGVRRAMEIVLAHANKTKKPIYTYGPLIHNRQVLDMLRSKGIYSVDSLDSLESGTIVIRAHGVPPATRKLIKDSGLELVDATCPRVAKVQSIIRSQSRNGRPAVIAGDRDHAEVVGLLGYSSTPAYVVSEAEEISSLPRLDKPFLVAQTTHNAVDFQKMVSLLKQRYPDITVFDTICEATHERQEEVRRLAACVDAMVVVGGYHSANTKRLAQISRDCGIPTYHVETDADLDRETLSKMDVIGVTAGASTPSWMIRNVVKEVEAVISAGEKRFTKRLKNIAGTAVQSNILCAFSALGLAHAASMLSARPSTFVFPLLASLYVFAVHISNRFLDRGASVYNDPGRAAFLSTHRRTLLAAGGAAVSLGMFISAFVGLFTFIAFSLLIFAGVVYSLPIFPAGIKKGLTFGKIKDIPGSRSLSEAIGWTAVIAILPWLDGVPAVDYSDLFILLTVLILSYIRALFFDVFQTQGDLIVGTETLPVILGEAKTIYIIKWLIVSAAGLLILAPAFGLADIFSFIMLLPVLTLSLCVSAYQKRPVHPGLNLDAMVEGSFILAGLLGVIWQISQCLK
jgi:(E)-4-hydroxy-3-methyl-but-2-enyl pyrophosphate reductase